MKNRKIQRPEDIEEARTLIVGDLVGVEYRDYLGKVEYHYAAALIIEADRGAMGLMATDPLNKKSAITYRGLLSKMEVSGGILVIHEHFVAIGYRADLDSIKKLQEAGV